MKSYWKTSVFNRYGGEMWLYTLIATVDAILAIFSAGDRNSRFFGGPSGIHMTEPGTIVARCGSPRGPRGAAENGELREHSWKILKGGHRRGRVRLAPGAVSGGAMPSLRQQQLPFQPPAVSFKCGALGALATFFFRRRLQGGSSPVGGTRKGCALKWRLRVARSEKQNKKA